MKRSAAICLVRKGMLDWIQRNVLAKRRGTVRVVATVPVGRQQEPWRPYIPEAMPPAEVSGCHFEDPVKNPIQPRLSLLSRAERAMQTDDLMAVACDLL